MNERKSQRTISIDDELRSKVMSSNEFISKNFSGRIEEALSDKINKKNINVDLIISGFAVTVLTALKKEVDELKNIIPQGKPLLTVNNKLYENSSSEDKYMKKYNLLLAENEKLKKTIENYETGHKISQKLKIQDIKEAVKKARARQSKEYKDIIHEINLACLDPKSTVEGIKKVIDFIIAKKLESSKNFIKIIRR